MRVCKGIYVPPVDGKWHDKLVEFCEEQNFILNYQTKGKERSAFDLENSGVIDTL